MQEPIRIIPRDFCPRISVNIEKPFLLFFSHYLNNEHKQVSRLLQNNKRESLYNKNHIELASSVHIGKILVSPFFCIYLFCLVNDRRLPSLS